MSYENEKDVLVALLKDKADIHYADVEHWYRIPTSTKQVPLMVKNGTIKYIAFWQPKVYGDDKWSVQWFAEVKDIKIVKGKDLKYPPGHVKAEKEYYKIEFDRVENLPDPIYAREGRRVLFITTTQKHLMYAKDINDIFYESPLEEKLWKEFKKLKINAERQWSIKPYKSWFTVDFALFCQTRNIAIECDGDTYHNKKDEIERDKERDNSLFLSKWDTMRFTSDKINYKFDDTIAMIREAVDKYGGLEKVEEKGQYRYIDKEKNNQTNMFE